MWQDIEKTTDYGGSFCKLFLSVEILSYEFNSGFVDELTVFVGTHNTHTHTVRSVLSLNNQTSNNYSVKCEGLHQ